ncbi:MAG: electron transfer flavoprotein subunit alpha/FixB family protein [Thermodesulfobacteriota bacterium]
MKPTNIWIWVHHREGVIDDMTFGLAAEAGRIIAEFAGEGTLSAIAVGNDFADPLERLGRYGVDRVYHFKGNSADAYHGEHYAGVLSEFMQTESPYAFLMAHTDQTADLAPRLAALNGYCVATRAVDLILDDNGEVTATRPIANGHLTEKMSFNCPPPYQVTFLPAVLNTPAPSGEKAAEVVVKDLSDTSAQNLKTEVVEVIEASPGDLDIEEADIVVAGGRGVGKDERFDLIHELAAEIGGSVAGTRPVVDWQTLAYERQIGQTGKAVTPQLIINCGISGANEYTAGMEKARNVIAVNIDPRARIFRFADLGVVGDVHQVLPLLIKRLKEKKAAIQKAKS